MTVNRTQNSLNQRPMKELANLRREMAQLKTPQKVGADVVQVQGLPNGSYLHGGPLTLTSGLTRTFIVTVIPGSQVLTLWNYLFTVTVDVDDPVEYAFPAGPSLSAAQRNLRVYHWIDWAASSDVTNTRVVYVRIENFDVSSHDVYLYFRFYAPINTGAST
jgi:hypothetical protein